MQGENVNFTLYTGSEVTVVTEGMADILKLKDGMPEKLSVEADNKELKIVGFSLVKVKNKEI